MRAVLSVTAVLEAATGLGILALPSVVSSVILGALLDTVAALVSARVAGVALLAPGTCWLARHDEGARAVRGLVGGMALYNVGVLALLAHAALVWGASGIALWPLVVGHAVMAFWCIVSLKARHPEGNAAPPSKELKRTSIGRIGRSQLIASVGRTEAAVRPTNGRVE